MAGRWTKSEEQLRPDPRFGDMVVSKFVNCVMWDGKKAAAQGVVYEAMDIIQEKLSKETAPEAPKTAVEVFHKAIENVKPFVEVRSKRIGGANYQVPMQVNRKRQQSLAFRWIIEAARGEKGRPMGSRLADELYAAAKGEGKAMQTRDQTHRISRARYEAERRLRGIDSLKEHFEAGADGVVVLDDAGRILFVNRAAERITGFARDGLLGSELVDMLPTEQRSQISDAISRVLAGVNVDAFDLELSTTSGSPVWVSVSTSTVLAGSGAVILAFRDVSAERALEHELRSTKEFLERLIDSTVDAIIAADFKGQIILFNQGAERLFGYHARDVIGKKPVWELYESGAARQIMRMLRSTSYGGVGRLEQTRREVRIASGETVPVSMSASIVYEREREVATVGILTDLRERIRMEQRLLDAQQKLQSSEKQALVAELAGAAAHELNQPLTSIIGYSQLIQRQSEKDAAHLRAVGIILSEAERMAGIVKKIGKITKYETTDYVGSAKMLDLDRAAADSADAIPIETVEGEESKTGEFTAVAPPPRVKDRAGPPAEAAPGEPVGNTPSLGDLTELADRQGVKR